MSGELKNEIMHGHTSRCSGNDGEETIEAGADDDLDHDLDGDDETTMCMRSTRHEEIGG